MGVGVEADTGHGCGDGLGCKDKVGEWVVGKVGQVTSVVGHMKASSRGKERTQSTTRGIQHQKDEKTGWLGKEHGGKK